VGQFSFEYCPLSHTISSGIYHLPCFGRLVCHHTPSLSLYVSPDLCSVLVAPLGGWLVAPPPSQPLLLYPRLFIESSAPCPTPVLLGRLSIPLPPPLSVLDYSSLCMLFSFVGCGEDLVCPGTELDFVPGGWVGSHTRCMLHAVLQIHVSSVDTG
jgi:hypothetical protein